jgi:tripartite-type tricarboxylate transporter receptor subunit TctC
MTDRFRPSRRAVVAGAGAAGLAMGLPGHHTLAQAAWPAKPVKVVVPYAAGGGADTLSRLIFAKVQEELGQSFVIDNRGGGGGTIGASIAAKAPADGYTILHDATAFSVNPTLLPSLPYDTRKDFVPVFLAGVVPNLLVVHPGVEQKTVAEIIAFAKSSGGLDWASSGNGTVQHLALELFRAQAGIKLNHVPYKGGAPALNDLMGGHIKYFFSNAAASTPHVKSGKIRAVAHTGIGRLASLPDVPPVADTLPGVVAYEWNGVFAPAGTPGDIVVKLNSALNNAIKAPAVIERMGQLSIQARANTPADFAAFVDAEIAKWSKVVRDGNIKPE